MNKYSIFNRQHSKFRLIASLLLIFVIIIGASGVSLAWYYNRQLKPPSFSQKVVEVTIQKGMTAHEIANMLEKAGVIRASWAFEWYVRRAHVINELQAGSYSLRPSMTAAQIAAVITQGKVTTELATFIPGWRLDQVRQYLLNSGYSTADVDSALDPSTYKDQPIFELLPKGASLEGFVYPDSYQRTATTSAQTLIKAALDQMVKSITPAMQASFTRQGLTAYQAAIFASIVEQEASRPADKPIVAQVFLRRFSIGMQLGSDPTAFYGAIIAGVTPSVSYDSAYNTRIHNGLPPSPIGNFSLSSLQAVAEPATSDYIYFVAGDDGIMHFSHTLSEHEALIRQYCKKLCS